MDAHDTQEFKLYSLITLRKTSTPTQAPTMKSKPKFDNYHFSNWFPLDRFDDGPTTLTIGVKKLCQLTFSNADPNN